MLLGGNGPSPAVRAGWIALLLAALLGGCAGDAPPSSAPGRADHAPTEAAATWGLAPLEWVTIWEGPFALAPGSPLHASLTVPDGSISVLVNLTTDAGALYSLWISMGECQWKRDVVIVAQPGQVWGADCGGVLPGAVDLDVSTQAGALAGDALVTSVTCDARVGRCPERLPPTTS